MSDEPAAQPVDTDAVDPDPVDTVAEPTDVPTDVPTDLSAAERDLAAVEAALERLDAGTYWTDEITGEPIDDQVLEADPLARRNRTS